MLFDWFKKENPITDLLGFGGGIGSDLIARTAGPSSIVGGTKTGPIGGYFFHYFTTPGTSPFTVGRDIPGARLILVAGGGAGSGGYGGGGGGGGIVYSNGTFPISTGEWTVEIGNGGAAGPASPPTATSNGNPGQNSNFFKAPASYPSPTYIRAIGGGGGSRADNTNPGGGSGGGAGPVGNPGVQPTANPGVPGITNAGNSGGTGPASGPGYAHGGGGGAGGVGQNASSSIASGPGGVGLGPPTWSWLPASFGFNGYFGGGGGGSGYSSVAIPLNGLASPDGTGGKAYRTATQNGEPGKTNTGGGGGGAATPSPGQPYATVGGAGGSGAMVIAYPDTL